MKFFDSHFSSLIFNSERESAIVVGVSGGRIEFYPKARWLYSLRIMLLVFKIEILWTTGEQKWVVIHEAKQEGP